LELVWDDLGRDKYIFLLDVSDRLKLGISKGDLNHLGEDKFRPLNAELIFNNYPNNFFLPLSSLQRGPPLIGQLTTVYNIATTLDKEDLLKETTRQDYERTVENRLLSDIGKRREYLRGFGKRLDLDMSSDLIEHLNLSSIASYQRVISTIANKSQFSDKITSDQLAEDYLVWNLLAKSLPGCKNELTFDLEHNTDEHLTPLLINIVECYSSLEKISQSHVSKFDHLLKFIGRINPDLQPKIELAESIEHKIWEGLNFYPIDPNCSDIKYFKAGTIFRVLSTNIINLTAI